MVKLIVVTKDEKSISEPLWIKSPQSLINKILLGSMNWHNID